MDTATDDAVVLPTELEDDFPPGPKFRSQQKVLCIDTNNATSSDFNAPLYEALIRKSELKYIDPITRKVVPKRKRGRGRVVCAFGAIDVQNDLMGDGVQEWCHLVHFAGWNSRWDRWVTEKDIFDDSTCNRKRVSENTGKVARPVTKPKEDATDKKRKREATTTADSVTAENSTRNLQLISRACELPFTLQTVLVDDREKITTKVYPPPTQIRDEKAITMLHVIPAPSSIVDLLGKYIQAKKQEDLETFAKYHIRRQRDESGNSSCSSDGGGGGESNIDIIHTKADLKINKKKRKEFALSLLALLDASLPLFLLYAEERDQFTKLLSEFANDDDDKSNDQKPKRQPSHLYPAEFLLRFIVKIPYLLSEFDVQKQNPTSILLSDEKSQVFSRFLLELIVFMQKRVDECFTGNYQVVEGNEIVY